MEETIGLFECIVPTHQGCRRWYPVVDGRALQLRCAPHVVLGPRAGPGRARVRGPLFTETMPVMYVASARAAYPASIGSLGFVFGKAYLQLTPLASIRDAPSLRRSVEDCRA